MLSSNEWPNWTTDKVCIDTETYDPHLKETGPSVRTGGHILGVSVAIPDGPAFYLPVRHNGGNLDHAQVYRYLQTQAKNFKGTLVGMNLPYDLDWLNEMGVKFGQEVQYADVMLNEALLDEHHNSYSLNAIGGRRLGEFKDDKELKIIVEERLGRAVPDARPYLSELSGDDVAAYAEGDVTLPLKILKDQEKEISEQGIERIVKLESQLLPVLVKMKRRGVRVDEGRLEEVEIRAVQERKNAVREFNSLTGASITEDDAMKKALLVKALAETGLPITMQHALDKNFLEANTHIPACAALQKLRKWNTLISLCINPVKQHLVNGRIHCNLRQITGEKLAGKLGGAKYGRMSCEHVNMQQQPARDEEIGRIWRRIYVPEKDREWALLDYSQQEPRILVHYAEALNLSRAEEVGNAYRTNTETDIYQVLCEMANIKRKEAKIIFLGLCYGMGGGKLCQSLGLPIAKVGGLVRAGPEGKRMFDNFHKSVPFVRELTQRCQRRAEIRGVIKTILGRKCRFPDSRFSYKGGNRLIQGSAADQTKAALVALDQEGFYLQLQVHDEVDLSVDNKNEAFDAAEIMKEIVSLRVPSKVDVEMGPSWGEVV